MSLPNVSSALPPTKTAAKMKIEAVITSDKYSDFLAHTLPHNVGLFDKIAVVTSPEDKATRKICDYYGVEAVLTDAFRSRWGEFCKGSGINEGLAKLDKDAWLCHLDSDIILPPHTRKALELADLDPSMIYGIDRLEFKSYGAWQSFIGSPEPQQQNMFIHTTHTGDFAGIGTRVAFNHLQGWVPIGYFQLWHAASGQLSYPSGHTTAAREDGLFPARWPRSKRALIPEILAYHLESEDAPMAINWSGRKSKTFQFEK